MFILTLRPRMPRMGSRGNVRVNKRLSKSERVLSYVRRNRRISSKPCRLIHCADRQMPSAVKVHTHLPTVFTLTHPGACYRWTDYRGGWSFHGLSAWPRYSSVTCIPSPRLICALNPNHTRCENPGLLQRETVSVSVWLLINTAEPEALHCTAFFLLVYLAPSDWPWPTERPTNQPTGQLAKLRCAVRSFFRTRYSLSFWTDNPYFWTHMTQNEIWISECQNTAMLVKIWMLW